MSATDYDAPEREWEGYEDEIVLPQRPRRRYWSPATATLTALLVGALGFYAGVRVEKTQLPSSPKTAGGLAALAAGRAGAAGGAGTRALAGRGGTSALFGGGGRFAAAFGGGSFGTVSSISGNTLYVTEASGNVIKVELSSATRITKSVGVGRSAIRPGDTVSVQGVSGSGGTVAATAVSDTGAAAARSAAGAGGSGSAGGAGAAVNSLFGAGGG